MSLFRRRSLEERLAWAVTKQLEHIHPDLKPGRVKRWMISTDGDQIDISLTMQTRHIRDRHIIQGEPQDA